MQTILYPVREGLNDCQTEDPLRFVNIPPVSPGDRVAMGDEASNRWQVVDIIPYCNAVGDRLLEVAIVALADVPPRESWDFFALEAEKASLYAVQHPTGESGEFGILYDPEYLPADASYQVLEAEDTPIQVHFGTVKVPLPV